MAAKKNKQAAAGKRQITEARAAVEPSVRVFANWTPQLIRSAEIAADSGNLRQAASLCEWLLSDDRVRGTLDTRIQALLGLTPTFEPSGDKRRSNRAVKALEAGEDWFAGYPESELAQMLAWGILLNVAPMVHGWIDSEGHGGRWLPCPTFWHPQHLRFDWHNRRWLTRTAAGPEVEIVAGDGTWILHTPYGENRPWAMGLWRSLSRWVLLKHYAISDWARHSEKGSILVGTCDKEYQVSDEQRTALAHELYTRGRESVAVLPPGFDLKLLEARADTEKIYNAQVKAANMAITIAIRGGNLTTEVSEGGSLAATEAQERTGDWAKLRDDSQKLTTTLHDQSLTWWAEFNFGDRKLAPWPVYPVEPKRDMVARANTATAAVAAAEKFQSLGFEVDPQGFIDEFELGSWLKAPPTKKLEPVKPEPTGDTPKTDDPKQLSESDVSP